MLEWHLQNLNSVIFSDDCRFALKNDPDTFMVLRTSNEASKPEFSSLYCNFKYTAIAYILYN